MDKPDFDSMTYEQIIEFCIGLEKEAVAFYQSLAEQSDDAASKALYEGLVKMEESHVAKLEQLDEEAFFETTPTKVIDLKTTDYLVVKPEKELNTQEVLILASQREKATRDLYETLADKYADEPFLHEFFTMMAEEEAQHKHDLESEYEKGIMGEM
ncbi:MAG: ferritin family protein [Fidelibacterota bacterium]|nr:MAG: ferritin family protein [Candidatus Neomarinimicrobiota bacterium]